MHGHSNEGRTQVQKKNASNGSAAAPAKFAADCPASLAVTARSALESWLAMMASHNFVELPSIIAVDAVYHSPIEWHSYPGRDLVCLLVRAAAGVLEDLKYERQFAANDSAALEFSAHVGAEPIRAMHLLRFNEAGEIIDIDIIARPAKGVMAFGNEMGARVGAQIKAALAAHSRTNIGLDPSSA
jgi:hypothetical protein